MFENTKYLFGKPSKKLIILLLLCLNSLFFFARGEESGAAASEAIEASGNLSEATFMLSGNIVWTIGEPLSEMVIEIAHATGFVIAKTTTYSMKGAAASMEFSADALDESSEFLEGDRIGLDTKDVVTKVVLMTASDALKLAGLVEGGRILNEAEKRSFSDLGIDLSSLAGSVLQKEGLEQFGESPNQMVFAVKTRHMLYLISLEDMQSAVSTNDN